MSLALPALITKAEFFVQSLVTYPRSVRCPYCRADAHELLARKARVVRVQRCLRCGLKFTRPIYRSRLSDDFYDELYSGQGSTTEMPSGTALDEVKRTGFRGTDKEASLQLARIREQVGGEGGRLLEIGSSWGYFLFQAKRAGFDAHGVEIGRRRREFGVRELDVKIAPSLDQVDASQPFDAVYTSHVLEHFTDLGLIFDQLAARLAPGGHLFIEVPNVDLASVGSQALRWMGAVHPLGFDSSFFADNLPKHGFVDVTIHEDWASPWRSVRRSSTPVLVVHTRRGT